MEVGLKIEKRVSSRFYFLAATKVQEEVKQILKKQQEKRSCLSLFFT